MNQPHEKFMRVAIESSRRAREKGNHPFGAILVDKAGNILLEAENTVVTEKHVTGHAETNLVRFSTQKFSSEVLSECTLYTSTEPCAMCTAAIFWSGIGRMVYGLSSDNFYKLLDDKAAVRMFITCEDVFERSNRKIEIIGGVLEDEAAKVHEGFWK